MGNLDRGVDERLRQLIVESGVSLRAFSRAAGRSTAETLHWWSRRGGPLKTRNLESLSQYFAINEAELASPDRPLPVQLLRERLYKGPMSLPERYAHHASSFVRSSAHIIEYLALTRGRHVADRLLVNMNVHPLIFANLDNRINLQFLIDLLREMKLRCGMSESEIESLGCYVSLCIQDTQLGAKFTRACDYYECYEVVSDIVAAFDTNFSYRVEIDKKEVRLYATPSDGERFLFGREASGFELVAKQKAKAMGWFPVLSGLSPVNMETPECVTRGDARCVYRFRLNAKPLLGVTSLKLLSHS